MEQAIPNSKGGKGKDVPCVNRLSFSTSRVWYWVQEKSNASGDMNSGTPLVL